MVASVKGRNRWVNLSISCWVEASMPSPFRPSESELKRMHRTPTAVNRFPHRAAQSGSRMAGSPRQAVPGQPFSGKAFLVPPHSVKNPQRKKRPEKSPYAGRTAGKKVVLSGLGPPPIRPKRQKNGLFLISTPFEPRTGHL